MNIIKENFKYFTIYETTNLINGKKYIGMHSTNNLNDDYIGSGTIFRRAVEKYGKNNFKKEILYVFNSFNDMKDKETELVTKDIVESNEYYNMKTGGEGGVYSDEVRKIISIKATGRKMPIESIEKGLCTRKKNGNWYKSGEEHHFFGKCLSKDSIQKMKSSLNNRYSNDLEVWNKGLSIKDIETKEERKKYGRNTVKELNPSYGSKWLGNTELGVKCYIKNGNTELEKQLKEIGWVEKPPNFNTLKSVTKNIKEYM